MKYAILSDIHSNLEALTAVLDDAKARAVDRILCLGDLVGYGADPEACLARLQALEPVCVAGNHDWACIGKLDPQWFNEAARRAILWTRDRLSFSDLDQLRRLPLTDTHEHCSMAHGVLTHPQRFDYLVDLAQALDMARACRTLIGLVGHTHVPIVFAFDQRQRRMVRFVADPKDLADVRLLGEPQQMRYIINPGSVGQPRDGDWRASYGIFDTDRWTFGIRRLEYDVATTQRKIREAGLPEFLADRLAVGR